MKHQPAHLASQVRFSKADARRARRQLEGQHAREQRYQELWIRFKREREAVRSLDAPPRRGREEEGGLVDEQRKTHAALMLEALSDGRHWSTHELVSYGAGYAVHSRASDLRKLGYAVKNTRSSGRAENAVYFYELQRVPTAPTRLEQLLDEPAAQRLERMRAAQTPIAHAQGFPSSPPQSAGAHDPTRGRLPSLSELLAELRAIDDEIQSLRDRVELGIEDCGLLDELLVARKELDAVLGDLEAREAA